MPGRDTGEEVQVRNTHVNTLVSKAGVLILMLLSRSMVRGRLNPGKSKEV